MSGVPVLRYLVGKKVDEEEQPDGQWQHYHEKDKKKNGAHGITSQHEIGSSRKEHDCGNRECHHKNDKKWTDDFHEHAIPASRGVAPRPVSLALQSAGERCAIRFCLATSPYQMFMVWGVVQLAGIGGNDPGIVIANAAVDRTSNAAAMIKWFISITPL